MLLLLLLQLTSILSSPVTMVPDYRERERLFDDVVVVVVKYTHPWAQGLRVIVAVVVTVLYLLLSSTCHNHPTFVVKQFPDRICDK